jgi:hypothetical protein
MDNWRTDFENAPKNDTQEKEYTHHKTGNPFTKIITLKVPIIISVGDLVIMSFWSVDREQWSGLADGEKPDAWMSWPKPYGQE